MKRTLSRTEQAVADLVAQGLKDKQIAAILGICKGRVRTCLTKAFKKLGVDSRLQLTLAQIKKAA
jgi:DNA-binding NarL/FixJ family response regulator